MSIPVRPGARLLFRVDPLLRESPRGYLCRVAHAHGYCSPLSLVHIAGLPAFRVERDDGATPMSHVLRLEPEEWRAMCYRPIKGRGRFDQRSFYGERISADDLNYGRPRICPTCLGERSIWWAVWDLGLVAACPIHRCRLLNQCAACKKKLTWQRPAVHKCRCGLDFRNLAPAPANRDLVAISAAIYRAAGFAAGEAAELDLAHYRFPPEMLNLRLGSLLRLVLFVGSIKEKDTLRWKQRPFAATDILEATEISRDAVSLLRDWPLPLREALERMVPEEVVNPAALNFSKVFGNFYRHLFRVLPRSEFGFLHDAFERFAVEDWRGPIRGQHRYFSAAARRNSQWMSADEAEKTAHVSSKRLVHLVRRRQIEGMLLRVTRGRGSAECWIKRESLNRWIAIRGRELALYMRRPEAQRTLGLKNITVLRVAQAGIIRYVNGSERCFATGYHFLREDVTKIRDAFEKHDVPPREYSKPGVLIALRDALRNYLGRDSGLPAVIRAVVDGTLVPVGYTKRSPGITGYLFLSEELRKYRPVSDSKVLPEGFLNYREAASMLETRTEVIRGLVAQGVLSAPTEYRNGLSKLVPAGDVQHFGEQYVAATVLARRHIINCSSLLRLLRQSGTPVLAIPILGKGHTFFVHREIAARMQPSQCSNAG